MNGFLFATKNSFGLTDLKIVRGKLDTRIFTTLSSMNGLQLQRKICTVRTFIN